MKTIIGLVGEIASGKTTATNYIKEKYRAKSFRFSDMLRDVLKRMRIEDSRQNMQTISTFLRQTFGDDIMSKALTADVADADCSVIITEGIRRPSDAVYLKKLDNFHIIAIKTNKKNRFKRLTKRAENPDDKTKTWIQFQKESRQESEQKIKDMINEANFTIDNNGAIEELYKQIDNVMKKIL